ncbi:MAG: PAS domain S-box protein [Nitrospirae bacterium]|nr:MAG: PAS domain S-box protein [Nitrospirota bacterium]
MNKKTHANSRRGRLKRPHAREPRAGMLAAETAGPAEDVEKMAVMIEELRVVEEELRVQNEELATARQAVEAERARYHELFECAPDGYLVTDAAGIIREANRMASAMLNAPPHGLLGKPFALYVAAVDRDAFRTYLSQVQSEPTTKEWDVRLKPRERAPLLVALTVAITQASPGTAVQMRWLLRDITLRKRAEEALRASEERFRSVTQSAHDAIISADSRGDILSWNKGARAIFGYEEVEVWGKPLTLLMPERYREAHLQGLKRMQAGGESQMIGTTVELHGLRKDGSEFPLELSLASWKTWGDTYYSAIIRDITQRKWVEQRSVTQYAVTRVLAEFATLTEATPQLLKVIGEALGWEVGELWTVDSTRNLLRRVETWHAPSFKATEFIALSGKLTFAPGTGLPGRVWQSSQPLWITDAAVDQNFSRAAMAAKVGLHGALGFPILLGDRALGVLMGLSREIRPSDPDLLSMLSSIGSQIGQFIERKRAEEALRESQTRLQAILDNSPSLIFLKDTEGRYLLVNQQFQKVFHRTREEIIGKTDEELFQPAEASAFRANDRKALRAGVPLEFEEVSLHDDGPHTSIVFKFPLRTAEGKAYAMGGITTDITDRKNVEVRLKDLLTVARALARRLESVREEERARIARDLHDEIGQALTALKLNLQVVQRDSPDKLKSPLERSVEIIDRLIERVRGISLDLRPSLLDDLGLIATLKWWTEHQAPYTRGRIELTADSIEPRLPLDLETACFRIVEEAVNNATKYAKARRINVILSKQDGTLDLLIRDDGTGFDVNTVLARAARGESMGLLGMEERVKHLGGLFTITSQPGRGTEVRATFPLGLSTGTGEKPETSTSR